MIISKFDPLSSIKNQKKEWKKLKTDEDAGDVITYDNLNNGYSLVYMTPDEVDQWKDDNGL